MFISMSINGGCCGFGRRGATEFISKDAKMKKRKKKKEKKKEKRKKKKRKNGWRKERGKEDFII